MGDGLGVGVDLGELVGEVGVIGLGDGFGVEGVICIFLLLELFLL